MKAKMVFVLLLILLLIAQPVAGGVGKFIIKAGKWILGAGAAGTVGIVGYSEYARSSINVVQLDLTQTQPFIVPESLILQTRTNTGVRSLDLDDPKRNLLIISRVPIQYDKNTRDQELFWIRLVDAPVSYNGLTRFEIGGKLIEKYPEKKGGLQNDNRIQIKYGDRKTLDIPDLMSVELKPSWQIQNTLKHAAEVEVSKITFDKKVFLTLVQNQVTGAKILEQITRGLGGETPVDPNDTTEAEVEWHRIIKN